MNPTGQTIHWAAFAHGQWQLYIAKTEKGLCYVSTPGEPFEVSASWIQKHFPKAALMKNEKALKPYADELIEYLNGSQQSFSLPIDIKGTPFQEQTWEALKKIPYGQTCSYSDIASLIEKPQAVRAVGSAIGANPVLMAVPCHRVIGKNGAITGYRGGTAMKRYLLQLEAGTTSDN